MHSTQELTSDIFAIERNGVRLSSFADLCPGFNSQDRLGVVVRHPLGSVSHANLIMSAVTAFYDELRKSGTDFFIYPDYFVFHAGCTAGECGMMDIWPDHKAVCVEDDAEAILRAVNDRGITLLALDSQVRDGKLQLQTKNSALSRIKQAFLAPISGARDIDEAYEIKLSSNEVVERYVNYTIDHTQGITEQEREEARARRQEAVKNNNAAERYRCVSAAESLTYL